MLLVQFSSAQSAVVTTLVLHVLQDSMLKITHAWLVCLDARPALAIQLVHLSLFPL